MEKYVLIEIEIIEFDEGDIIIASDDTNRGPRELDQEYIEGGS